MCVWRPLVHDAKRLSGDFYNGKKIERVYLKFCVSNGMESSKILQKCFEDSTLLRMQVFEWDKA